MAEEDEREADGPGLRSAYVASASYALGAIGVAVAARRARGAVRVALGLLAVGLGVAAAWIFVFVTALRLLLRWGERMADDVAADDAAPPG
jgi:hypothetical protein